MVRNLRPLNVASMAVTNKRIFGEPHERVP